jgi:hypothetical protein
VIAAAGFALFAFAGTESSYWTGFFPGFVVLGFGMSLTVAPLTTTVMGSVSREHSGVASGINNAVSEGAGLLMVALMGIAMSMAFDASLARGMEQARLSQPVREQLERQRSKLAAIEIAPSVDARERAAASEVVRGAFVQGFRGVMGACAFLALFSAIWGWICLGGRSRSAR